MSRIVVDVSLESPKWARRSPHIARSAKHIVRFTLDQVLKGKDVEVSLVLVDDAFIKKLNKHYRGKNKPTNVLSFPQTEKADLKRLKTLTLGDIVISYECVATESKQQNKLFVDHYTHLIVHGCLHLLHYDHMTEKDAKKMENMEIKILSGMGIKNPYELV